MGVTARAARMVGRAAELEALERAVTAGARGEPGAVLVRGEAGIGKSRLVREVLDGPAAADAVTAIAHCVDLGPVGAPLTPIRRLLRDLHAAVGSETFRTAAGSAPVLGALAMLVPDLDPAASAPAATEALPDAVERLIAGLGETVPLVLVVEDIHWADAATLAVLRGIATTLRDTRLTLVMTLRTDDVERDPALRDTLAELGRSRAVTTVEIARLGRDSVAEHAGDILDRAATEAEVDTLMSRAEGVPFFVEELLGIPQSELPATLREVVLARFERLDAPAQAVVRVAAVAGARCDHGALAGAWPGDEAALTDGLRAALAGHVLGAEGDVYVFRHALIREAVYEGLLPGERVAAHRRLAATLWARVEAGMPAAAAPAAAHWLAADNRDAAFDATVVALAHAREALTVETAARLGERLVDLWHDVDGPERRAGVSEFALRFQVATDYAHGHRLRASLRVIDAALRDAPPDDAEVRVPLLMLQIDAERETERRTEVGSRLDELDRLIEGRTDAFAARYRAQSMGWRASLSRGAQQDDVLDAAVALAESTGDATVIADVLTRRAKNHWSTGRSQASIADLERVLELRPDPTSDRLFAVNNLVCDLLMAGRYDDAIELGMDTVAQTVEAGKERAGSHILSNTAEAFISSGRLDEGIAAARRSVRLARGDSIQVVLNAIQIEALGLLWDDRRDDYRAIVEREPESRAHAALELQWIGVWHMLLVDAAVAEAHDARPAERAAILAAAVPLLEEGLWGTGADRMAGDLDVLLVSGAGLVHAGRAASLDGMARIARRIRELTAHLVDEPSFAPEAALIDAQLAEDGAADAWREALARCDTGRAPRRYAHLARYRLAEALLDRGERDEAVELLRATALAARDEGVSLVARWARELLSRLGDGRDARAGADGLTAREAQVLALVAEGLTNAQIGERLFISRKTASVHVSAILAKIGAANRAEAAAYYATAGPGNG